MSRALPDRGFVALVMRMPGHGAVPAGSSSPATTGRRRRGSPCVRPPPGPVQGLPLHLVGYSNGGALAVKYAIEAMDDPALPRPNHLVLMSPMIGVTEFARFAGIAGWPAVIPSFVRAAWFSTLPEFNPFKYNSFPVNAAVQAQRLTAELRTALTQRQAAGRLTGFPPILTFQSAVDSTVSPRAVIATLYGRLPANGSELVLYDLNRAADLGPLIRPAVASGADGLLPARPAPLCGDGDRKRRCRHDRGGGKRHAGSLHPDDRDPACRALSERRVLARPRNCLPRDRRALRATARSGRPLRRPPRDRGVARRARRSGDGARHLQPRSWNPFYDAMIARIDRVIER